MSFFVEFGVTVVIMEQMRLDEWDETSEVNAMQCHYYCKHVLYFCYTIEQNTWTMRNKADNFREQFYGDELHRALSKQFTN